MTALLWAGAAGAWLFIAVFLIDGWTRPGYSPARHAVSALATGPRGWIQTANFLACGLAITAAAAVLPLGLASPRPVPTIGWVTGEAAASGGPATVLGAFLEAGTGHLLLGAAVVVFGLSVIASGAFPMDPMRGYPPGTPEGDPPHTSRRHVRHDQAGTVVFTALPAAAAIAAFVLPELAWKLYSGTTAAAALAGLVAFGYAWEEDHPRTGLVQRATIVVGWTWLGALFLYAAA
ncbi:DUF998 domain-containing protein [Zafaria sp. J156]|uniref:DUF998 domain-containing protein n=1 Tax=Zafaria sp. J156 TaxID=3116490 RepID=UPI002E76FA15|nr:DUF998 domain-containing protein [Zafaria sp. J156]MEE1621915.1 DUF998 domain-containing protein [Zafaria sp. J156]